MDETVFLSPKQKAVFDCYKNNNDGIPSIVSIARQMNTRASYIGYIIHNLCMKKILKRVGHGKYVIIFTGKVLEGIRRKGHRRTSKELPVGRTTLTLARRTFIQAWQKYEEKHTHSPCLAEMGRILGISRERARQLSSYFFARGYLELRLIYKIPSSTDLLILDVFNSINRSEEKLPQMEDYLRELPDLGESDVLESLNALCKLGYLVKYKRRYYNANRFLENAECSS